MENYKVLNIYSSSLEATMVQGYLESHGLHPTFQGSKDYSSHVTGFDSGRYELCVPLGEFQQAQELLKLLDKEGHPEETLSPEAKSKDDLGFMKKSIYTFLLSLVILPILGNVFSIYYAQKAKSENPGSMTLVLTILNIAVICGWSLFYLRKLY